MVSLDEVGLDEKLSDLTVDAVAEPPRKNVVGSSNVKKIHNECPEKVPNNLYLDNTTRAQKTKKPIHKSGKNESGTSSSKIYGNVINVSNSSHVQVGPTTVYNFGTNKSEQAKTNINIQITKEIEQIFRNTNKVTVNELDCISTHVGENWKDLGRKLHYSDGQLAQFHLNFIGMKMKEVIYQMLLDWTRVNPKKATIGEISTVLWECDMKDVVVRLSSAINSPNNE